MSPDRYDCPASPRQNLPVGILGRGEVSSNRPAKNRFENCKLPFDARCIILEHTNRMGMSPDGLALGRRLVAIPAYFERRGVGFLAVLTDPVGVVGVGGGEFVAAQGGQRVKIKLAGNLEADVDESIESQDAGEIPLLAADVGNELLGEDYLHHL